MKTKIYQEITSHRSQYAIITVGLFVYASTFILHHVSFVIEHVYSRFLFVIINQLMSTITGWVPFSIAEILYLSLYGLAGFAIMYLLIAIIQRNGIKAIRKIMTLISILYLTFMGMWGLNYYRMPLITSLDLPQASSKSSLILTVESLMEEGSQLRNRVDEDAQGIMKLTLTQDELFVSAHEGYSKFEGEFSFLRGSYGRVKPVALSHLMLYTQITGMYFPFTSEANVNTLIPDVTLPFTVLHEIAHQRGIASEDEANFIAYVASRHHPHPDVQYSGVFMALRYSLNALARVDIDEANALLETLDPRIREDMRNQREFWLPFDGKVSQVSDRINDTYLKSNQQKDGVESYGRMVDLLVRYLHPES